MRQILYAYGDDKDPLDETIRVVDEMVTDYIIELSHKAQHVAEYSGRSKIKNDDFLFTIRKDELATGRVKELHMMEKRLKEDRKQFDTGEGKVGLERGGRKKVCSIDSSFLIQSVEIVCRDGLRPEIHVSQPQPFTNKANLEVHIEGRQGRRRQSQHQRQRKGSRGAS